MWGLKRLMTHKKIVNILSSQGTMNKKPTEISGKIKCNYSMKTYNSISDTLCF